MFMLIVILDLHSEVSKASNLPLLFETTDRECSGVSPRLTAWSGLKENAQPGGTSHKLHNNHVPL